MKERHSNQRQLILSHLRTVKNHPSAEMIYEQMRKTLPNISLGTVYRNLEFLKSKGELIELQANTKRYDANLSDHHHFMCKKCHKIIDFYKEHPINLRLPELGHIEEYQIIFKGTCNACLSKPF